VPNAIARLPPITRLPSSDQRLSTAVARLSTTVARLSEDKTASLCANTAIPLPVHSAARLPHTVALHVPTAADTVSAVLPNPAYHAVLPDPMGAELPDSIRTRLPDKVGANMPAAVAAMPAVRALPADDTGRKLLGVASLPDAGSQLPIAADDRLSDPADRLPTRDGSLPIPGRLSIAGLRHP
jgi:hypothetical protein